MGQCIQPIYRKVGEDTHLFPCSSCPECLKRRLNAWTFRLLQEEKHCDSSTFATFTYEDSHLIHCENRPTLYKKHMQDFFKRLRKRQCGNKKSPIKYFVAGEYGSETQRPHYHALIFNSHNDLIDECWNFGLTYHGKVEAASINYCIGYIMKGKTNKKPTDVMPEFQLHSQGLGLKYLTNAVKNYHKKGLQNAAFLTLQGGNKVAMPRYYRNKIYEEHEWEIIKQFHADNHKYIDRTSTEYHNSKFDYYINSLNKRKQKL